MPYLAISIDIPERYFDDAEAAVGFRDELGDTLVTIANLIGKDYHVEARIEHVE